MEIETFVVIGENIHCTRVLKREGKFVTKHTDGRYGILYKANGRQNILPIPDVFLKNADWENGKVKRCAVAVWQGMYGKDADQRSGIDYLQTMARSQESAGAAFLDINVDEFSMDVEEQIKAMKWLATLIRQTASVPLSIDSSSEDVMRAGLHVCDTANGQSMVNSISLERMALLDVISEYKPAVVASAAGEKALPATVEDRMVNLQKLIPQLTAVGIKMPWIHIDPLVYPISTDSHNAIIFLDTIAALRRKYGSDIHVIGGLSNISFGMPCRSLINKIFSYLTVESGGDGGIVDPLQVNAEILRSIDTRSDQFKLAKSLLTGDDEYGVNFISAYREGKLSREVPQV